MIATPALQKTFSQIAAIEQRRVQSLKVEDGRLARAEKRIAAAEAKMVECRKEHDDACTLDADRLSREVAKIRTQTDRKISDTQARGRAARERQEVVEEQTRQVLAEIEAIKARTCDMRSQLQQEVAVVDKNVQSTLHSTDLDVRSLSSSAAGQVHGIFGALSSENVRVWALEDHERFAMDLTGAKTLEWGPDAVRPRAVMPFGDLHNPFDGYGTYGLTPPQKRPKGFKAETARRLALLEKLGAT